MFDSDDDDDTLPKYTNDKPTFKSDSGLGQEKEKVIIAPKSFNLDKPAAKPAENSGHNNNSNHT
jgi:hypothetical protein